MELNQSNLEESVIRRTICVTEVPETSTEQSIVDALDKYGEIQYLRVDAVPGSSRKVALVQYAEEGAAETAIGSVHLNLNGVIVRPRRSSITIEVIPPTDAVFGKPMTVGRHVMAVNHSREQRGRNSEQKRKSQRAREAAAAVLEQVSRRTGWEIPDGAINSLLFEENDEEETEHKSKTRRVYDESAGSRSRSAERNKARYRSDRRRY
jgi:hypothetical protein